MRAVIADRAGGPEVLRSVELPDPRPGPGQVRVAVDHAAISFIDTQLRAGTSPGPGVTFPLVLGNGVSGLIDAVAEDVDPVWLGERVVTATGGSGGYASAALARTDNLHRLPALSPAGRSAGLPASAEATETGASPASAEPGNRLTSAEAAAMLADGRTAVGLHRVAQPGPGEVVVVTAAAGGVGGLLVQLAAAGGAQVVALAGSERKLAHARALGAHHGVNYRDDAWERTLADVAPGVDVVFDGIGAPMTDALFPLVRSGGRYLPHGAAGGRLGTIDPAAAAARQVTIITLGAIGATGEELFALVEEALRLTALGALRPTIGQTFPLADAAAAHAAIEARATIGKTLLTTA
ncbi:Alcohol dehydrogenase [Frankia sp. AiPs1]|uniref:zinc-binding dehydrogenase n=1 Tax=Frankia sp. AiPa1 TaxID=573492 RepID=UPI00202B1EAF|nr:zinc-binding dehydrogenase [Frankia sp. AiPa1]MCL9758616.1 zinc-binding dehydrogenase [Frankia sp. AiPa1]